MYMHDGGRLLYIVDRRMVVVELERGMFHIVVYFTPCKKERNYPEENSTVLRGILSGGNMSRCNVGIPIKTTKPTRPKEVVNDAFPSNLCSTSGDLDL